MSTAAESGPLRAAAQPNIYNINSSSNHFGPEVAFVALFGTIHAVGDKVVFVAQSCDILMAATK